MFLNFAPIRLENKEYTIYRIPYLDKNQLEDLREKYNSCNSFFRHGEYIYHSPMSQKNFFSGGEKVTINANKNPIITKSLIHHILFRHFYQIADLKFTGFDSITFFSTNASKRQSNDSLYAIIDDKLRHQIGYWRGTKLDTRVLDNGLEQTFGLTINVLYEWKVKVNCKELAKKGLDITKRFAIVYKRYNTFTIARLIGKIVDHNQEYIFVEKDDNVQKYQIDEVFLENSYQNRQDILETVMGHSKAQEVFRYLYDKTIERRGGKKVSQTINGVLTFLRKKKYTNHHGFTFVVSDFLKEGSLKWETKTFSKPSYVFNIQGNHTNSWHDGGLEKYGPYSAESFPYEKPKVIIICRKDTKGDITQFFGKFLSGVRITSTNVNKRQPFEQGFLNKYRLSGLDHVVYTTKDESIAEYDRVIRQAIEENERIDIALVETCEKFKELPATDNPYYFTKAKLLQNAIPSQEVLNETMKINNNSLAYVLNNMSLAFYAKLGGKPWLIPNVPNIDHEMVIGIGNKVFKKDRFLNQSRVVGITTIFSGDGNYEFSNTSKDVPYEEYLQELLISLKANIKQVRTKNNWQKGDTLRLIFHVFKPFSEQEIDTIESVIGSLENDDFQVEYAYLTISHNHPFLLLDESQIGVKDYRARGKNKGVGQPLRGKNIKLDEYNFLLQLIGPQEVKTYRQGLSSPVLIKLHPKSTFKSLEYLTRQIYQFSHISWRSFLPSSLPVTLDYSNQIASILGNLREIEHWNSAGLMKLKYKAWFL